ncbi:MAG TPA: hypothetical protein VKU80_19060 [Planctomycetota bacterium]|nr:hypothetical protein [Planctomycetota bacterium]
MMGDLKNAKLLYAKGLLFVILGGLAAGALVLSHPDWRTAALLAVAVWAFSRSYYFAFYVIEHYVDPGFKFSGLGAFALYVFKRRTNGSSDS